MKTRLTGYSVPLVFLAMLLLCSQYAALVHAADHPFHLQDDYCASLINLEHHHPADPGAPASACISNLREIAAIRPIVPATRTIQHHGSARGPPL